MDIVLPLCVFRVPHGIYPPVQDSSTDRLHRTSDPSCRQFQEPHQTCNAPELNTSKATTKKSSQELAATSASLRLYTAPRLNRDIRPPIRRRAIPGATPNMQRLTTERFKHKDKGVLTELAATSGLTSRS